MKSRDLVNLLNRAAAAIEMQGALRAAERDELIEDLTGAAEEIDLANDPAADRGPAESIA